MRRLPPLITSQPVRQTRRPIGDATDDGFPYAAARQRCPMAIPAALISQDGSPKTHQFPLPHHRTKMFDGCPV